MVNDRCGHILANIYITEYSSIIINGEREHVRRFIHIISFGLFEHKILQLLVIAINFTPTIRTSQQTDSQLLLPATRGRKLKTCYAAKLKIASLMSDKLWSSAI